MLDVERLQTVTYAVMLKLGSRNAAAVAAMLLAGAVMAHAQDEYNFGAGPVPAHRHPQGGGWIANTATVAERVLVTADARVFDLAVR